mgnify:CR=1 FL=1
MLSVNIVFYLQLIQHVQIFSFIEQAYVIGYVIIGRFNKGPDINAVVHTHPPLTIGVIAGGGRIGPMFPDFVAYLGSLGYIDYVTPCTAELARAVQSQVKDKNGVLMLGHGALTVGQNLKEAFQRTELIEESARILIAAKQFGEPRILTSKECDEIRNLDAEKYRMELIKKANSR